MINMSSTDKIRRLFNPVYFLLNSSGNYDVARAYGDGAIFASAYKNGSFCTALKMAEKHINRPDLKLLINFPHLGTYRFEQGNSVVDVLTEIIVDLSKKPDTTEEDVLNALSYMLLSSINGDFEIGEDKVFVGKPLGAFDFIVERLAMMSFVFSEHIKSAFHIPMEFEFNGYKYQVDVNTDVKELWAQHQENKIKPSYFQCNIGT